MKASTIALSYGIGEVERLGTAVDRARMVGHVLRRGRNVMEWCVK
jgi:ribosomal protein L13E